MNRPLVRVVCGVHKGQTVGRVVGSPEGPTWRTWMPVGGQRAVVANVDDSGPTPHDLLVLAVIREGRRIEARGEPVQKPIPKVVGPRKSGQRLNELGVDRVLTLAEVEEPDSKWEGHLPAWCQHCRAYTFVQVGVVREALARPAAQRVITA